MEKNDADRLKPVSIPFNRTGHLSGKTSSPELKGEEQ